MIRVVIGLAAMAMAVSACATTGGATPHANDSIAGTWKGSYECNAGPVALTLQIPEAIEGHVNGVRFAFGPRPDNPGFPTGSYLMNGLYNPVGSRLVLVPDQWEKQPEGFVMAPLDGEFSTDHSAISGHVANEWCMGFSATRVK